MRKQRSNYGWVLAGMAVALLALSGTFAVARRGENPKEAPTPVAKAPAAAAPVKESFPALVSRLQAAKPAIMKRQWDLLHERYDLRDQPAGRA